MPTVLVVEDKDSDIRLLYQFLKSAGVENIKVASGAFFAINALEKAGEKSALKPDVMIVDLALGNDSGYEVLRYWKSNPS